MGDEREVTVGSCRRESPEAQVHRDHLDAVLEALRSAEREGDWDSLPDKTADWFEASLVAFEKMRERDSFPLSDKQYAWVEKIAAAIDVDLHSTRAVGPVPRGKPVALLSDAMPRPLKPPGRA